MTGGDTDHYTIDDCISLKILYSYFFIICRNDLDSAPHLKGGSDFDSYPMDLMMMKDYPDFSHEGPELSAEDQVSTIKYKILNFSNLKNFCR